MILLISFDVKRRGGIERLTQDVAKILQKEREVRLLYPRRLGSSSVGRLCGRIRFMVELAYWLRRADLVLSMHSLLLKPVKWVRWVSLLQKKEQALVCWLHGVEVWGKDLAGVKGNLEECTRLIASSTFTRDTVLSESGTWPQISVVQPMADLIDAKEKPADFPEHLCLLTVSRLDASERYKGHRYIMQALSQLKKYGVLPKGIEWRVVGDGSDRKHLERECEKLDLLDCVSFLGGLSDADLKNELRSCSVFLMPSQYSVDEAGRSCGEGFGIVYLEAAQAGRASIACMKGGQTDVVLDKTTGWLIDSDVKSLADLLIDLDKNPEKLRKFGNAAHTRAIKEFSESRFKKKLIEGLGLADG